MMARRIGPYSRADLPTHIDGRTREAAFLRGVRAELVQHVGGAPTATQRALIEAAAQLRLRIAMMDRKFAETGVQTEHDSNVYLAWVGSLGRLMTKLDAMRPAPKTKQTLAEYVNSRPAAAA